MGSEEYWPCYSPAIPWEPMLRMHNEHNYLSENKGEANDLSFYPLEGLAVTWSHNHLSLNTEAGSKTEPLANSWKMPPIRTQDPVIPDVEVDDDGMPPLVDNPGPPMAYTFFTDMTPNELDGTEPTTVGDDFGESPSVGSSPPESPLLSNENPQPSTTRASHGKKRDASYIPRPPNAFILFRSSFIRSEQVPGKVEGNHSTLSKIIGMYWKTLPREEREQWEAKAVIAQAEHRKKYPDWRFRPGANAMAKLKVKDGPGTAKRKTGQSRRQKEGVGPSNADRDKRCAKIADLLVEGKKGSELEAAVKEWEGVGLAFTGKREEMFSSTSHESTLETGQREISIENSQGHVEIQNESEKSSNTQPDNRFDSHLTNLYKRALSAPVPARPNLAMSRPHFAHTRSESITLPISPSEYGQLEPPVVNQAIEDPDTIYTDFSMPPSNFLGRAFTTYPNEGYVNYSAAGQPVDLSTASAEKSTLGPSASSTALTEVYSVQLPNNEHEPPTDSGMTYSVYRCDPSSQYSALDGWAGNPSTTGIRPIQGVWDQDSTAANQSWESSVSGRYSPSFPSNGQGWLGGGEKISFGNVAGKEAETSPTNDYGSVRRVSNHEPFEPSRFLFTDST